MSKEQLDLLLETARSLDDLYILPHNDPDPDAIAGVIALQHLLAQTLDLKGRIAYKGIIGRAENRALVRYLDHPIPLLVDTELSQTTPVALIDTQPGTGNNPCSTESRVVIVIDHHPWRKGTAAASFVDVRPEVGAVSTILLGYLQAAKIELPTWLATALFYGIKTDTRGLSREVSSADTAAYFYLQPRIDVEAMRPPLPMWVSWNTRTWRLRSPICYYAWNKLNGSSVWASIKVLCFWPCAHPVR